MTDVLTDFKRGVSVPEENQPTFKATASSAITRNRLVYPTSTGAKLKVAQVASYFSPAVVGASGDLNVSSGEEFSVKYGRVAVTSASIIAAGDYVIVDTDGKVRALASSTTTGKTIVAQSGVQKADTLTAGTHTDSDGQPNNDDIEVVSDGADTRVVTIYGTAHGSQGTLYKQNVTLNGAVAALAPDPTGTTNWSYIAGVSVASASTERTITVRKKTGPVTLCTIPTNDTSVGIYATTTPWAYGSKPTMVSTSGVTTMVGLVCTGLTGSEVLLSAALTEDTALTLGTAVRSVDYVLVGNLASTVSVTVKSGTAANATPYSLAPIGIALTPAATAGDLIDVLLLRPC